MQHLLRFHSFALLLLLRFHSSWWVCGLWPSALPRPSLGGAAILMFLGGLGGSSGSLAARGNVHRKVAERADDAVIRHRAGTLGVNSHLFRYFWMRFSSLGMPIKIIKIGRRSSFKKHFWYYAVDNLARFLPGVWLVWHTQFFSRPITWWLKLIILSPYC